MKKQREDCHKKDISINKKTNKQNKISINNMITNDMVKKEHFRVLVALPLFSASQSREIFYPTYTTIARLVLC